MTGVGEARATPDLVTVQLGTSLRAPSLGEASTASAEGIAAMIAALSERGVGDSDRQTTQLSIRAEYDYHDNEQRLLGYRATNMLDVTIRDIATAGDLIDAAVTAGGDGATVSGVSFSIEDETALAGAARDAAWADAVARATQIVSLSGRALGEVLDVVEITGRPGDPSPLRMAAMAESVAIEPGTTAVTVRLQVRFALD